jgi:hypothetical protein
MKKITFFLALMVAILMMVGESEAVSSSVIFPGNSLKLTIQKYEPNPVEPGGIFDLYLRAEAIDDDTTKNNIKNLGVELVESFPFFSYTRGINELGTLNEGNIIDFRYRIKVDPDAVEDYNEIRFKYYSGDKLVAVSPPLEIKVKAADTSLDVSEISTEPDRIKQGVASKMTLKIKNTADSVMRDIQVKMNLDSTPITTLNSINEKSLRILERGEVGEVIFDIIANADAVSKAYNIPLNITYEGSDGVKISKNYAFGLLIGSEPEYLVNLEDSDSGLVKGKSGDVVISLSNTGVGDIKFAVLTLLGSKDYDIISNDKVYLGNLESDDYETAEFKIFPKKSGWIELEVLVEYKDAFNGEANRIETLRARVYTNGEAVRYGLVKGGGGVVTFLFYVVVILLAVTFYRNWKKCKDAGKACSMTSKKAALVLKKIVRSISLKKFIELIKRVIKFFREP